MDTRTGYPVREKAKQVTVTAETAQNADILSTVLFILGEEKGNELLRLKEFEDAKAYYYR